MTATDTNVSGRVPPRTGAWSDLLLRSAGRSADDSDMSIDAVPGSRVLRSGRAADLRARRDAGVTFIEIVLAIALMGIIVVPILIATTTAIKTSSVTEEAAQVETLLVNAVDRVNRTQSGDCTYTSQVRAAVETVGWPPTSAVVGHEYLENGAWVTDPGGTACPGGLYRTNLVQRITVTITSPSKEISRTLEVVKGDV